MSIIAGTAIESALGGYRIERSLRFNSADSAYLNRTLTTPTNNLKWTFSCWFKRSAFGSGNGYTFINAGGAAGGAAGEDYLSFIASTGSGMDGIVFAQSNASTTYLLTTPKYRDPSAWYHLVFIYDSANATSSNRALLYINGVQVTAFSSSTYPTSSLASKINSAILHRIGCRTYAVDGLFDGYMTEINFIDGSALDPTSFGEYNSTTGVWQPIAYTGSYGTNGFYLNFSDNSNNTATTLGKDYSGNGNNWTPNNFVVTTGVNNDSLVDTPTPYGTDTGAGGEVRGNYCTINVLSAFENDGTTFFNGNYFIENGNLTVRSTGNAGNWGHAFGSIVPSNGKWYFEINITNITSSTHVGIGIPFVSGYFQNEANARQINLASPGFSVSAYSNGDVFGCAFDLDNQKVWFAKNGTWFQSGDPAAGTNAQYTNLTAGANYSAGFDLAYTATLDFNFGQRPFAYTAPSGFASLCTTNLSDPTIADGSTAMNVVLYQGNSSTQTISGVGFQPDLVWVKNRSTAGQHVLTDVLRGTDRQLFSSLTNAEQTSSTGLTAFTSDGFSLGANPSPTGSMNSSPDSFVAWNWKANGAGVSNTAGTITSTVSANTTAGFSIATYTGTGGSGTTTVGHGLSNVAPAMVIVKRRNSTSAWPVYHKSLTSTSYYVELNTTAAQQTYGSTFISPGSTTLTIAADSSLLNASGGTYVAYCFAPVESYSAIGSYVGNGSANGPFIYCGFRPRYVLAKNINAAWNWIVWDSERNTYNQADNVLQPNNSNAEYISSTYMSIDILSNGFKLRTSDSQENGSGNTLIYAAFAENPFKYALAR